MKKLSIDDTPLNFGKHRGKTPRVVAKLDPSYIVWLKANVLDKQVVSRELAQDCEDEIADQEDVGSARPLYFVPRR